MALILSFFLCGFKGLLQTEHLVTDIIADLNRDIVLKLEFFATAIFQYCLALLVGAFILPTPIFVFIN